MRKVQYAIYSPSESQLHEEPLFWSNEFGWTSLDQATFFTEEETQTLNTTAPDGIWVMAHEPLEASWDNNYVQFARLIAEINATFPISFDEWEGLKESMDLNDAELNDLFERATEVFETAKKKMLDIPTE